MGEEPSTSTATVGPRVAIAGDIATSGNSDKATASLVDRLNPDHVLTSGDNAYPDGTAANYTNHYKPSWGRFAAKTHPAPGNHDYRTTPPYYYTYFDAQLPEANSGRYYAFDVGDWRLYSLNCEVDCSTSSPQAAWLRHDLASAGAGKHKLAYVHHPRYSCGRHGSSTAPTALWNELIRARTDVVVAGHDHNYQRFPRMDASGNAFMGGPVSYVVGTGGAGLYGFGSGFQGCGKVRYKQSSAYGVLELTLGADEFSWRFVSTRDAVLDAGTEPTLDPVGVQPPVDSVDVPVRMGSDDAEQAPNGSVDLTSTDAELVTDRARKQVVGLRFAKLPVPQGARITDASLQFQVDEVSQRSTSLTVRGQDADSASTFSTKTSNVSGRPRTGAAVVWSPPNWNKVGAHGAAQRTPSVAAIVQEVVNRPGWTSDNALAFVVTGSGQRTAEAFNGGSRPVTLHVEYIRQQSP